MRKLEAAHEYEIAQITNAGPNWKAAILMQQTGASEGGEDGGMPDMGGDIGGDLGGEPMDLGSGEEEMSPEEVMDENPGGGMEAI
jgi:hypothetical protein